MKAENDERANTKTKMVIYNNRYHEVKANTFSYNEVVYVRDYRKRNEPKWIEGIIKNS